jgi:hypothetical protein
MPIIAMKKDIEQAKNVQVWKLSAHILKKKMRNYEREALKIKADNMKSIQSKCVYLLLMLCTISHTLIMDAHGSHGGGHHRGGHRNGGHRGGYGRRGYGYGGYGYGGWGAGAAVLGTTAVVGATAAAAASSSNNADNAYRQGYTQGQQESVEQERDRLQQENERLRQQGTDE